MNAPIELPADLKLISSVGDRERHTACVMSAVAWIAGEPLGDAPQCASGVIRPLAIRLNDGKWWRDAAERTAELLPLAHRIVGTNAPAAVEIRRAKRAAEWALTFAVPFALDAAATAVPEPHKTKLADFARRMRERADPALARTAADAAYAAYAAYAANAADAADAAYAAYAAAYAAANAAANAANAADAAAAAAAASKLAAKLPLRCALQALIVELIELPTQQPGVTAEEAE